MDHLQNLFKAYKSNSYNEATEEASKLLQKLKSLSPTLKDVFLIEIFDSEWNIINFLEKAYRCPKVYKDTIKHLLDLIKTLINTFYEDMDKYTPRIIQICQAMLVSIEIEFHLKTDVLIVLYHIYSKKPTCSNNDEDYELYKCCFKLLPEKLASTVLEHLLKLLGLFAKRHPLIVHNYEGLASVVLNKFHNSLVLDVNPNVGYVECLSDLLQNFPFDKESSETKKMYDCLKSMLTPRNRVKVPNRASLDLFTKHISLLEHYIDPDLLFWQEHLLNWLESTNNEDLKVGYGALIAYYKIANKVISESAEEQNKGLIKIFADKFFEIIHDPNIYGYKLRLAIIGLGLLSTSYMEHLTPEEMSTLYLKLHQEVNRLYILNEPNPKYIEYLPNYLETLGKLIFECEMVYHVDTLEKLTILLFKMFSQIAVAHHFMVISALLNCLSIMHKNNNVVFEKFIEKIVYIGVIYTCSHQIVTEVENEEYDGKVVTFKTFLPIWNGLLGILKINHEEDLLKIHKKVYIELIKTLLILISKLNLAVHSKDLDSIHTDHNLALEAVKMNDIDIFVNIVDFYTYTYKLQFLQQFDEEFKQWLPTYIKLNIKLSNKYPLISGFHKLLSVALLFCKKTDYFSTQKSEECFEICRQYIQQLLNNIASYKEDLQISCLQVILNTPTELLTPYWDEVLPTFVSILEIGKSYIKLAQDGLDVLEEWSKIISPLQFELLLKDILPIFDSYLCSRSTNQGQIMNEIVVKKARKRSEKMQKVMLEKQTELEEIKRKILLFIAKLDAKHCVTLANSRDRIDCNNFKKTTHLKLTLPFKEQDVDIYLEALLPRVLELALNCSDRKTRMVACEFLHSSVAIMLGTRLPEENKDDINGLFEKIISAIVSLASTIDQTVRSLFCPLLQQLIHWYSHPSQVNSVHTPILISVFIELACHSENIAIMDTVGQSLKEFIVYTRKQCKPKDFLHIEEIIKKINLYCMHPDNSKRKGAIVIFNNIYSEIREEETLVNKFWFALMNALVMNLSYINNDHNVLLTLVYNALNHIQKVIIFKERLFNNGNSERIVPVNFKGNRLQDALLWLFEQTASNKQFLRKKCQEMFAEILLNLKEKSILNQVISNIKLNIFDLYGNELKSYLTLNVLPVNNSTNICQWLEGFLLYMNGFIFIFSLKEKLPTEIKFSDKQTSNFFLALNSYFSIADLKLKSVLKNSSIVTTEKITSINDDRYNTLKIKISKEILRLTVNVFLKQQDCFLIEETNLYFSINLWTFLAKYLFKTSELGFYENIKYEQNNLLNLLNELPEKYIYEFVNVINSFIDENLLLSNNLGSTISLSQKQFISGLVVIQKSQIASRLNLEQPSLKIITSIFSEAEIESDNLLACIKLDQANFKHAQMKLEFALNALQNLTPIKNYLIKPELINIFKSSLLPLLLQHLKEFFDILFTENLTQNKLKILLDVIEEMKTQNKMDKEQVQEVIENCLRYCLQINEYLKSSNEEPFCVLEIVKFWTKIVQMDQKTFYTFSKKNSSSIFQEMVLNCFTYQHDSLIKSFYYENLVSLWPCLFSIENFDEEKIRSTFEYFKTTYVKMEEDLTALTIVFDNLFKSVLADDSIKLMVYVSDAYSLTDVEIDLTAFAKQLMLNCTDQFTLLNTLFDLCENTNYKPKEKYKLVSKILVPLLNSANYNSFEEFYCKIISNMLSILNQKIDLTEDNLMLKTVYLILLDTMFSIIKLENLENGTCPIMESLEIKDKATFVKTICLCLFNTRLECVEVDDVLIKEAFRLYQSHSYIALVKVILNTKNKVQSFLFSHIMNGEDVLWKNMINVDVKHKFEVSFDEIPAKRKVLLNIRSENQKDSQSLYAKNSMAYLHSQKLFQSTLKEDISKYDFSHAVVRSQLFENIDVDDNNSKNNNNYLEIELEEVDINKHICMPTICALISQLYTTSIQPDLGDAEEAKELPEWMKAIVKIVSKSNTPTNVRLFLVKVIENCKYAFKPFAKWLIEPIFQVIVDGCAGNEINFYISDLMQMVVSWYKPSMKIKEQLSTSMLIFLIEHIHHNERPIFKHNLDLLKTFLEVFKTNVAVPNKKLLEMLNDKETKIPAIQIIAVCLVNNVAPWPMGKECQNMLMSLLKSMESANKKELYSSAAETTGMVLHYMKKDLITYEKCIKNFVPRLQNSLSKISDCNQKLYCLGGISKYYPEIVNDHIPYLISQLVKVQNDFKALILDTLLTSSSTVVENSNFLLIDLESLLSNNKIQVQISTLNLMIAFIDKGDLKLSTLLKARKLIEDKNLIVNNLIYDLFIKVYKKYSNSNLNTTDIFKLVKDTLLDGLSDEEEIEEKLLKFWTEENQLPKEVSSRYLHLLDNLFNPNIEDCFLSYSIYIVLNSLTYSEKYNKAIYDKNLCDCDYTEYAPPSWRSRHSSITPMFTSSQAKKRSLSLATLNESMTLLTKTCIEQTPIENTQSIPSTLSSSSSLLFNVEPVFKDPNNIKALSDRKYAKRFNKDKQKTSRSIAIHIVQTSHAEEAKKKDLQEEKAFSVKFIKKYLYGEFPNIKIDLSEVVKPLQMLAKHDSLIAQILFVNIFKTVGENNEEFLNNASKSLSCILESSKDYTSFVISAILEIAINHEIQFSPKLVAHVSEKSGLMPIGCLLLENYIINNEFTEPPAKKNNLESREINCWTKMAQLYRAMDEWDVVSAIFLKKMQCNENVEEAILAESRADWSSALQYYSKACYQDTSHERKDFYYESLFKCFANLSQWNELSENVKNIVNSDNDEDIWQHLWNDTWNQHNLMPWYIKSEIRNTSEDTDKRKSLLQMFNAFLMDENKKQFVKSTYKEELAYLWFSSGNIENSKVYLDEYINDFLNTWDKLSPKYTSLCIDKLLNMQNVLNLLIFVENFKNGLKADDVKNLLEFMIKTDTSCPIMYTETKLFYRYESIDVLANKDEDMVMFSDSLEQARINIHSNMFKVAIHQQNFHIAKKYFTYLKTHLDEFDQSIKFSKLLLLKSYIDKDKSLKCLIESLKKIDGIFRNGFKELDIKKKFIVTNHLFDVTEELAKHDPHSYEDADLFVTSIKDKNVQTVGIQFLERIVQVYENQPDKENNNIADGYLKLAYAIYKLLPQHKSIFIKSVLRAIYYGSEEAKQLFPCLLNNDILKNENEEIIDKEFDKIPTLVFVPWIPQLLATLDQNISTNVVSKILIKIAEEYPQSIMYFYLVSLEKPIIQGTQRQLIYERIEELLKPYLKITKELIEEFGKLSTRINKVGNKFYLKDASLLMRYCHMKREREIEIPGLYMNDGKLHPKYHPTIVSFFLETHIYNSKCKPIKISMLGSDAKKYSFIVKSSEDLRLDQRVQQIFTTMNNIYKKDRICCQKNLQIATFNVVTLSPTVGLIEFVENAIEIGKFIRNVVNERDLIRSAQKFNQISSLENPDRPVIINKFIEVKNMLPEDILSWAFKKISTNIEHYVQLRQKFAQSYATMCLSNWVLGVGDRHLENILISQMDGKVIGIDFGYVFGVATFLIRQPELVPFRLTPQIMNLMNPFRELGFIRESMVHCLKALRQRKLCIISIMNVFLHEKENWIEYIPTYKDYQSCYIKPDKIIARVEKKLNGEHPSYVFTEDIQDRLNSQEEKDKICRFIIGEKALNYRATFNTVNLSAEEQVSCLIDQATDDNLLGRMYIGWKPWI